MKKIMFFFIFTIFPFVIFCQRECNDCNRDPKKEKINLLITALIPKNLWKVKIKNTIGKGFTEINFQDSILRVNSDGEISDFAGITKKIGKYKITNSADGTIFYKEDYDYSEIFNDGKFIRENSTLINNKCNLFDGQLGKIVEIGCN